MGYKDSFYIKEKNIDKHRKFNIEMHKRNGAGWKIKLLIILYSFMNNGGKWYPNDKSVCSACIGELCRNNYNYLFLTKRLIIQIPLDMIQKILKNGEIINGIIYFK